jgi:peptidoglycan LD-endopeptidase LytH
MVKYPRGLFLSGFLIFVFSVSAMVWLFQRRPPAPGMITLPQTSSSSPVPPAASQAPSPLASPAKDLTTESPSPGATTVPTPTAEADEPQTQQPLTAEPGYLGKLKLIIPVVGVTASQLRDTFAEARSEGRVHDAIDIPAPQGTPVLAAADGEIIKLFESERGGTTIYQLSNDKKLVYYYAHLQRYTDGIAPGKSVRQGDVIAYVGDTGNAGAGNYHLHFSIAIVSDPKRYWEGTNINPYPLLHN